MTAREIAAAVDTSDATVVRTARSLGFESLRELRRAIGATFEADLTARFHATVDTHPSSHDVLDAVIDEQIENLEALRRRVPATAFDEATHVLAAASHVWWCGIGPSASLADYAAFLSRRLGLASGSLTHAGTDHADELLAVGTGHAVVVLAYGRIHRYVRVLLSARQQARASRSH